MVSNEVSGESKIVRAINGKFLSCLMANEHNFLFVGLDTMDFFFFFLLNNYMEFEMLIISAKFFQGRLAVVILVLHAPQKCHY